MTNASPTWADLLADEVRQLEARSSGHDPALGLETLRLLKVVRGYETRIRQIALKSDYRVAGMLPARAPASEAIVRDQFWRWGGDL